MMKIDVIDKIFNTDGEKTIVETFSKYTLDYRCNDLREFLPKLNQDYFEALNANLGVYNYNWNLYIEEFAYSISQDSFKQLIIEDGDEVKNKTIQLIIHKNGNDILVIDDSAFNIFIQNVVLENILKLLSEKKFPFLFVGQDFSIIVGHEYKKEESLEISTQCNYRNHSQYPLAPGNFYFKKTGIADPQPILSTLSKISLIYSMIYLFNSSEINNNKIKLIISGNKTFKYVLDFSSLNITYLKFYDQIYKWIYSEKSKIEDKIGLSRNILTSYLKDGSIEINNSVFNSILSSNQIYIKGNISKYFEIKNKVVDQIEQTINNVNRSLEVFFSNFQKSIFVFISFFLSFFVFKIIKGSEVEKVFTRETSLIGLCFIGLSLSFFIVSIIVLKIDVKRIKKRYKNVKKRYVDVLVKEDIEKILDNDSEFNDEISYLNLRVKWYQGIWAITIVLFTVILFLTSDYLEIKKIATYFFSKK